MSYYLDPIGWKPVSYLGPVKDPSKEPSFSSSPGQQPPSIMLTHSSSSLQNRTISVQRTKESIRTEDPDLYARFFQRDDISACPSGDEQWADRYRDEEPNRYEIFFGNNGKIQHSRDGTECVTGTLVITGLNEDRNYRTLRFLLPVEDETCFIPPCSQFPKGKLFESVKELEAWFEMSYVSSLFDRLARRSGHSTAETPPYPPSVLEREIPFPAAKRKSSSRGLMGRSVQPPEGSMISKSRELFFRFFRRDDIAGYGNFSEKKRWARRYQDADPNFYEAFFMPNGKIHCSLDGKEYVTGHLAITGPNGNQNYKIMRIYLLLEGGTCLIPSCPDFPEGASFASVEKLEAQLGVSYIPKTHAEKQAHWRDRQVQFTHIGNTSDQRQEPEKTQFLSQKRPRDDLFSDSLAKRIRQVPAKPEISFAERQGLDELEPLPENFDHLPDF